MKNRLPIKLINFYQNSISPNTAPKCRFYPSCSQYAKECYEKFNFVKASLLTTKRLLKCNRLFKGGYDPVPLSKAEKENLKKENDSENDMISPK
ncbi:TPA: membrane protein insertion efficiency factor YidD [Candidatus Avacholeplasma faecigallinarum]|nr:membrane protein insertion efficiency factor YidD [Candidatus Avacholeplasma faecigallinarum]